MKKTCPGFSISTEVQSTGQNFTVFKIALCSIIRVFFSFLHIRLNRCSSIEDVDIESNIDPTVFCEADNLFPDMQILDNLLGLSSQICDRGSLVMNDK